MRFGYLSIVIWLCAHSPMRATEAQQSVGTKLPSLFDYRKEPPAEPLHSLAGASLEGDVLVLEPHIVIAPNKQRGLAKAIEENARKMELKKFSFVRGGPILERDFGKYRLELGMWSNGALIKLSW